MVILIVLLTVVVFIVVDLLLRTILKRSTRRSDANNARKPSTSDCASRSVVTPPSLKSVEVPDPKARILAVDDESIVLDRFPEDSRARRLLRRYGGNRTRALGLVEQSDYDFVFTDLRCPTSMLFKSRSSTPSSVWKLHTSTTLHH